MAKDTAESLFWEMLRSVVTLIGWILVSLFGLLWMGIEALTAAIRRHEDRKEQEAKDVQYQKDIAGPNADTAKLEAQAAGLIQQAAVPTVEEFIEGYFERYLRECEKAGKRFAVWGVRFPLLTTAGNLYLAEHLDTPPAKRILTGEIEAGRYRDELLAHARKLAEPGLTLATMGRCLNESSMAITRRLPAFARQGFDDPDVAPEEVTSIPLIEALPQPGQVIEEAILPFFEKDVREIGLFAQLRNQLHAHYEREGRMPGQDKRSGREILSAYLGGTELAKIFEARVPFEVPISRRMEHTAIVAGSGWGKTQLLQSIIVGDLESGHPPGIVVIDSTGAMVRRIQRLALFNERLKDRLIIIDPEIAPAPALNMFDISSPRLQRYDATQRESIESDIISLFNYVFSSIDNPLTAQQATPFTFMVRLLLSMPGANVNSLIELLEDSPREGYDGADPKFKSAIERLDDTAQKFFKTQYYARGTSEARRDQIAQRIYGVIKIPAFQRMFSTINKLDMFSELNKGSIILVNTSQNLLREGSATFGRYMIARTMAAAFERATIPEKDRWPSFLIVDEAAPYFDDTFETLLTRVRQFRLGVVIAFQHLEQASQKLRSAIASSTSVKYAGGIGHADRTWLAREMETMPDFIS